MFAWILVKVHAADDCYEYHYHHVAPPNMELNIINYFFLLFTKTLKLAHAVNSIGLRYIYYAECALNSASCAVVVYVRAVPV